MNDKVIGIRTVFCKKCGQSFIPAPMHVFREGSDWYCKWTCYNHRHDKKKEVKENDKTVTNIQECTQC